MCSLIKLLINTNLRSDSNGHFLGNNGPLMNESYSFDRFAHDLQSLNQNQALLNLIPALNANNNTSGISSSFYSSNNNSFNGINANLNTSDQSELTFNLLKDIIDDTGSSSYDDFNFGSNSLNNGPGFNASSETNTGSNLLTDKFDHLSLLN
jgi:hypothetical protein